MINNTSIGKQIYKQKKENRKGLESLVLHSIFGFTANRTGFTNFWVSNSSGKLRVRLADVLVLDPLLDGVSLGLLVEKCSDTFPSEAFQNWTQSQQRGCCEPLQRQSVPVSLLV